MYKLKHLLLILFTITLVNSHISIAEEFAINPGQESFARTEELASSSIDLRVLCYTDPVGLTDFSKIIDKAKEIEERMRESQERIKNISVEGSSGSDSVKVTLNGEGEMIKILISDEILKEDKSILEDLILAAHNNAKEKLKSKTTEEISKATGGFGIPGFKWPLT